MELAVLTVGDGVSDGGSGGGNGTRAQLISIDKHKVKLSEQSHKTLSLPIVDNMTKIIVMAVVAIDVSFQFDHCLRSYSESPQHDRLLKMAAQSITHSQLSSESIGVLE